jgi:hypothetical protein
MQIISYGLYFSISYLIGKFCKIWLNLIYCFHFSFFFWSLCFLSFSDLLILIIPLVSSNYCTDDKLKAGDIHFDEDTFLLRVYWIAHYQPKPNCSVNILFPGYAAGQLYIHTSYTARYGGPSNAHGTSSSAESDARMFSWYSVPYNKLLPFAVMFEGSGSCGRHRILDGPP